MMGNLLLGKTVKEKTNGGKTQNMLSRQLNLFLLIFVSLLLGACAPAPDSTSPTSPAPSAPENLDGTSWQLIQAVTPQGDEFTGLDLRLVTLAFQGAEISGNSGCNRYFGTYSQQGDTIKFSDEIGATKMACPEIQMALESSYFAFLRAAGSVALADTQLILSGAGYEFTFAATK